MPNHRKSLVFLAFYGGVLFPHTTAWSSYRGVLQLPGLQHFLLSRARACLFRLSRIAPTSSSWLNGVQSQMQFVQPLDDIDAFLSVNRVNMIRHH